MHKSYLVEADGRFIGVAVAQAAARRFVAVHPSVEGIDGATFPSPDEARRVAALVIARNGGLLQTAGAKR